MAITFPVADGITAIDTMMVGQEQVTSAYLLDADEPTLIETGPTTSLRSVLDGLEALGVGPEGLAHIVVTHIHLDHAGGAGALAPHFPRARVWVHERGAPHLAEPTRLVASVARVYGQDVMTRMFGPVIPVPTDRLRSVTDGDQIAIGGRALDVIYTPGHASHHVCLVDSTTGALFTGDALGVFLPDAGVLRPATPPPEFDLELAVGSIRRIEAVGPSLLMFSHFGPARDVSILCGLAVERLQAWTRYVEEALAESTDLEAVTSSLEARTQGEFRDAFQRGVTPERYEVLSGVRMNAMGIMRYLQRARQETER